MSRKDKGTIGYYKELAKEVGYPYEIKDNVVGPFLKWAREKGILVDFTDVERKEHKKVIENSGCKTEKEYLDKCAQNAGFKDHNERQREYLWNKGVHEPAEFNEDCSSHFGEFTENLMIQTFEDAVKMPYGNPGFDWICKKGDKIDNKGRCLTYDPGRSPRCVFPIGYNNIADWFILSTWNNRDSLNPLHVWAFHKNDIVRGRKFWRRVGLSITNTPECLKELEKWEVTNRLEKLKEICNRDKDIN